ncbi:DnaJ domain-containing protein [Immundisolibacter sp.]|uniref:DnaJ domain-containing protein n=1 Tax=Immundisolibacter sp. TaxID=1934948 RepID=UPI002604E1B1|nr:DnaJ domain-containing protein [Immundisolibacter sp.]MDD3651623.1 DnaJ domain-containing protein [Immundisolibacter sp.]
MSKSSYQALELALALSRAPALAAQLRQRPLPPDVLALIRIAAADDATLAEAAAASGEAPQRIAEAAVLFLQQALFAAGADSYRLLGVPATASQELIKLHHRWLVRWLHPDRQTDDWQAAYMNRVNRAWQDLRTPERRYQYDTLSHRTGTAFTAPAVAPATLLPLAPPGCGRRVHLSARSLWRLPCYLLGAAGLFAGAAFSVRYLSQHTPNAAAPTMALVRQARPGNELPTAHRPGPLPTHRSTDKPPGPARPQVVATEPPTPAVEEPTQTTPSPRAAPQQIAAADTSGATDGAPSPQSTAPAQPPRPHNPLPAKVTDHTQTVPTSTARKPAPKEAAIAGIPAITNAFTGDGPTPAIPDQVTKAATAIIATLQSPPAAVNALPDATLTALPARLADAYQRGDLTALLRLFAPEIQTEHGGYVPTTTAYQVLFASSTRRTLTLHDIDWQRLGADRAIGRGQFESTIRPRGQNSSRYTSGTMVLHVITPPNGPPLLASLRFEDGP